MGSSQVRVFDRIQKKKMIIPYYAYDYENKIVIMQDPLQEKDLPQCYQDFLNFW